MKLEVGWSYETKQEYISKKAEARLFERLIIWPNLKGKSFELPRVGNVMVGRHP